MDHRDCDVGLGFCAQEIKALGFTDLLLWVADLLGK